jgi:DNA repair exonuclease SbcCD nuclease subunit
MSSAVRFLHCAGFRFDSPFWEGPAEWEKLRNQDLWQTFEAVLSLCRTEKVDFLFLTGDLFEQEYVSKETVARVAGLLAKLDEVRIFITPGEKDPWVITSAYRLVIWPRNVHIFSGSISCVEITSPKAIVYGAGWTAYRQERPFLEGFQVERDGMFRFLLLHAEVDSGQNTKGFIPITPEQIASSGLTYLALGHKEVWNGIQKAGETFWADCGSPEARGFQQRGPHGVLLGEIMKESCSFEYRELAQRRYIEKVLALQSDLEGLVEKIMEDTDALDRHKDMFRIKLSGSLQETEAAVPKLQRLLADNFRYVEVLLCEYGMMSQIGQDVMATVELTAGKKACYPTLVQVLSEKIQEHLVAAGNVGNNKYWELVQKIGMAAIGQGWEEDED